MQRRSGGGGGREGVTLTPIPYQGTNTYLKLSCSGVHSYIPISYNKTLAPLGHPWYRTYTFLKWTKIRAQPHPSPTQTLCSTFMRAYFHKVFFHEFKRIS